MKESETVVAEAGTTGTDIQEEESRVKTMHVMEGDLEKAGEGGEGGLGKLLEDVAPVKTEVTTTNNSNTPQHSPPPEITPTSNGLKLPDEIPETADISETVKVENEKVPEVKEEVTPEESDKDPLALVAVVTTPTPPMEEANVQSRAPTPKENNVTLPSEVSRKRSIEKEGEGDGSSSSDSDSCRKRNKIEQETEVPTPSITSRQNKTMTPVEDERERMISEFVSEVSTNSENIGEAAERLAKEVENLAELATTKEIEWNAILRVKKIKEEMLERLLRKKRINCLDEQPPHERPVSDNLQYKMPNNIGVANLQMPIMMRNPRLPNPPDISKQQRAILPKPPLNSVYSMPPMGREGRNGPVIDVKAIIDEYSGGYRSRHPESTPRRGRRVRGPPGPPEPRFSSNPSLISMANLALGTGASVRTVSDHMNFMALGQDQSRGDLPGKEVMKSNGAKPYPEVTLHPVSPPSLLHQVLTKSAPPRPASFSPTLARLLTAPERPPAPPPHFRPPSKVSIADILSSTKKSRNEITITPVSGNPVGKTKEDVVLLDDDDGEGGDRLVIDEGNDEVPQCQGCRQKSAQFVCAACGNQWYCSRECQISAWEEHSEVCTD